MDAILLIAIYAIMWRILFWLVVPPSGPADLRMPWPRGVQEGEPVRFHVESLAPPSPPEPFAAVTTSPVRAHVSVVGR